MGLGIFIIVAIMGYISICLWLYDDYEEESLEEVAKKYKVINPIKGIKEK